MSKVTPYKQFSVATTLTPDSAKELAKLLLTDELSIVWGLFLAANSTDLDSIVSIILKFFDEHNKVEVLMRKAVRKEIGLTLTLQTLFRQNNFASKLLSMYGKRYGLSYLKHLLDPTVSHVLTSRQSNPKWSLEVDPMRLEDPNMALTNMKALEDICRNVIEGIISSKDLFPTRFRGICTYLKAEVDHKFPGEYPRSVFAAIGGFVFLRYICPALVVPHKYGLLDIAPTPEVQRDLLLISKVLQTLANGISFGNKEEHMVSLNPFIESIQPSVLQFLDALTDPHAFSSPSSSSSSSSSSQAPPALTVSKVSSDPSNASSATSEEQGDTTGSKMTMSANGPLPSPTPSPIPSSSSSPAGSPRTDAVSNSSASKRSRAMSSPMAVDLDTISISNPVLSPRNSLIVASSSPSSAPKVPSSLSTEATSESPKSSSSSSKKKKRSEGSLLDTLLSPRAAASVSSTSSKQKKEKDPKEPKKDSKKDAKKDSKKDKKDKKGSKLPPYPCPPPPISDGPPISPSMPTSSSTDSVSDLSEDGSEIKHDETDLPPITGPPPPLPPDPVDYPGRRTPRGGVYFALSDSTEAKVEPSVENHQHENGAVMEKVEEVEENDKKEDHKEETESVVDSTSQKLVDPVKDITLQVDKIETTPEPTPRPISPRPLMLQEFDEEVIHVPNLNLTMGSIIQLEALTQYLALYWQKIKPQIVSLGSDESNNVHMENYVQMSVLLTRIGVTTPEAKDAADKLKGTKVDPKKEKKEKKKQEKELKEKKKKDEKEHKKFLKAMK